MLPAATRKKHRRACAVRPRLQRHAHGVTVWRGRGAPGLSAAARSWWPRGEPDAVDLAPPVGYALESSALLLIIHVVPVLHGFEYWNPKKYPENEIISGKK